MIAERETGSNQSAAIRNITQTGCDAADGVVQSADLCNRLRFCCIEHQLIFGCICFSCSASERPVSAYTKTLLDFPLSGIVPIGSTVTRSLTC